LVKRNNAKGTVLILHGFMCNKRDVSFLRFLFLDYNIMSFDFRAHGENIDRQYCTFGRDEALDVIAAAHFLRKHPDIRGKTLIAYGFSMGSVSAIEAQAQDSRLFDGMVLDCPFESTKNIVKRGLKNLKISLFGYKFSIPGRTVLERYAFHPYIQSFVKTVLRAFAALDPHNIKIFIYPIYPSESIKKVLIPCLFIHCKNDKKVTLAAVKKVYENSGSSYKKFWITNGRHHFDSFFYNPEAYAKRVKKFIGKLVLGRLAHKKKKKIIIDRPE
jgi:pimeloyl-ACP methyl ester carboxylesterase